MSRASATPAGTLVLDREGLAKAVRRAREVTQWLALALTDDLRVITSAATVVEVAHPRLSRPALEWTLSRVVVEPVTEPIVRRATAILAEAGLHGHRHAIDAMLSATALAAPGPVTVLTSDPEDIATLCGRNVTVIKVLHDGPRVRCVSEECGDFNVSRESSLSGEFVAATGRADAFAGGCPATFRPEYLPAGATAHCIDFILTAGGVTADSTALVFAGKEPLGYLSDHIGLRARLSLTASRPCPLRPGPPAR